MGDDLRVTFLVGVDTTLLIDLFKNDEKAIKFLETFSSSNEHITIKSIYIQSFNGFWRILDQLDL